MPGVVTFWCPSIYLCTLAALMIRRHRECETPVNADPLNSFPSGILSLPQDKDGTTRLSFESSPSNGCQKIGLLVMSLILPFFFFFLTHNIPHHFTQKVICSQDVTHAYRSRDSFTFLR